MKKMLVTVMAICLVLAISACNNNNKMEDKKMTDKTMTSKPMKDEKMEAK